jgi:hypothetical protein
VKLDTPSAIARSQYAASIKQFCTITPEQILGEITLRHRFELLEAQRDAWIGQINILKEALSGHSGSVFLEFGIPRMGKRIDAVVLIGPVVFVLEFKVGADGFLSSDCDQVVDYALDLQNFHEGSHSVHLSPVLVATEAPDLNCRVPSSIPANRLLDLTLTNAKRLREVISTILKLVKGSSIQQDAWQRSSYKPTPTIIEATLALYRGHSVTEISRSDAGATNLSATSSTVAKIIADARRQKTKVVCFVTGVPGAGKTLVGLDAATKHIDSKDELYSVFLSGNGPLVNILQEALARDKVRLSKEIGQKIPKGKALSEVKAFIQNVHHFRDECLRDPKPPIEHVAIFDEAQRAWDLAMTADFMKRKRGTPGFAQSEPEFLLSCLDRHPDWAVVICLVGGGQEINRGEAGIGEWLKAMERAFPSWRIFISDELRDREYSSEAEIKTLSRNGRVEFRRDLHLATSMRSFRSEKVSRLVKEILDLELARGTETLTGITRYPIVLTRDLSKARKWLRQQARGSERYGIMISSHAERLKPHALDVRTPIDPVQWFLNPKDDVRSSYYLEDAASEFDVQGLELDWTCVVWDADFRYTPTGWNHWSFRGNRWERVLAPERQTYLKNAYRVLLTRARQGMVIVVPDGDHEDPTRARAYYDPTFDYLRQVGFPELS